MLNHGSIWFNKTKREINGISFNFQIKKTPLTIKCQLVGNLKEKLFRPNALLKNGNLLRSLKTNTDDDCLHFARRQIFALACMSVKKYPIWMGFHRVGMIKKIILTPKVLYQRTVVAGTIPKSLVVKSDEKSEMGSEICSSKNSCTKYASNRHPGK